MTTTTPSAVHEKAQAVIEAVGDASIPDVVVGSQEHPLTKAANAQALTSGIGRSYWLDLLRQAASWCMSTWVALAFPPPGLNGPLRSPRTLCCTTSRCWLFPMETRLVQTLRKSCFTRPDSRYRPSVDLPMCVENLLAHVWRMTIADERL